ncbi:Sucrase-isomaltase, intestinal [Takifugu flavidus]|uniref:alpha-glucosidase n=1 Tax=Takifugu flavidus TaxID=433684 RepID=A0A5C6PG98_9TELE|nr:Sucrase-isomaltase, intestinal [Takifugu flavidus]
MIDLLIQQQQCEKRGCCWSPLDERNVPWCFFPTNHGYLVESIQQQSPYEMRATMKRMASPSLFGADVEELLFYAEMQSENRLRFKIYDGQKKRFEVPHEHVSSLISNKSRPLNNVLEVKNQPFGLTVRRTDSEKVLFDTTFAPLVFADQYLQLSAKLPSHNIYGLGEHVHRQYRHDTNWKTWPIFTRDGFPNGGTHNLYGHFPFFLCLEDESGKSFGVFLMNSNAMEVTLQPAPAVTYRTIGGILDFYIFFGDTPEKVVQEFLELIGRPVIPPYWSLGFQLSRWNYGSLKEVKTTVERNRAVELPYEQRFYSEPLPDVRASHLISKAEPGHPLEETHFSRLYPRSCSFGHHPALMVIEACQPGQPYNIKSLKIPRADLIRSRSSAARQLFHYFGNFRSGNWMVHLLVIRLCSTLRICVGRIEELLELDGSPHLWCPPSGTGITTTTSTSGLAATARDSRLDNGGAEHGPFRLNVPYRPRNMIKALSEDVQYTDIDYMEDKKDFTYDRVKFDGLPEFADYLHVKGQKYILILDPAIATSRRVGNTSYDSFDRGTEKNAWVFESDGKTPLLGEVWPGETVFPDYTSESCIEWWVDEYERFSREIKHDALWIDMNEVSNFKKGSVKGCVDNKLNYPPYTPKILDKVMYSKTLCMDAQQAWGSHYDVHSLYGYSMVLASERALKRVFGGNRTLMLTRSSFPGIGKYSGHWLGDNAANWNDIKWAIPGMLEFGLFGVPYIGADICGFFDNSSEELCRRWMQVGAFYPFSRNHNAEGYEALSRIPGPNPRQATVARKNSPLTGRNLEQDQAHGGDPPADGRLGRERGEGGGQVEDRIGRRGEERRGEERRGEERAEERRGEA